MPGELSARTASPTPPAVLWLMPEASVTPEVHRHVFAHVLSVAERARHARLRTDHARGCFVGGRLLVRHVLAEATGLPAPAVPLTTGPFGKPLLEPNPWRLRFSLSHTAGLVACLVSVSGECGVDVESTLEASAASAVASFLATREQAVISASADPVRTTARFWVVKEAYLKALGVGLTRALDSFVVRDVHTAQPRIEDPLRPARAAQIALTTTATGHLVATAILPDVDGAATVPVVPVDFPDSYSVIEVGDLDELPVALSPVRTTRGRCA